MSAGGARKRPPARGAKAGPPPRGGGPARAGGGSRATGPAKSGGRSAGPPKGGGARSGGAGAPAARGGAKANPRAAGARATKAPAGRPAPGRRAPAGRAGSTPLGRAATERGLGGTQVEGRQAVRELLLAGRRRIHEVMVAVDLDASELLDDIVELARDLRVPVREVSRKALDAISRTEAAQGVVARAAEIAEAELDELCRPRDGVAPFLVAVDGVTDPGNLGALIRTAECAGVTGVILPRHRAVHVTPTVTKASAGAVEYVPLALVGGLPAAIERMKAAGVWVVGLDAGGDHTIHDLPLASEAVCLVLGAEGKGLSRLVRQRCDVVASIPLRGQVASLNVATAGALAMYEIVRRRA